MILSPGVELLHVREVDVLGHELSAFLPSYSTAWVLYTRQGSNRFKHVKSTRYIRLMVQFETVHEKIIPIPLQMARTSVDEVR